MVAIPNPIPNSNPNAKPGACQVPFISTCSGIAHPVYFSRVWLGSWNIILQCIPMDTHGYRYASISVACYGIPVPVANPTISNHNNSQKSE